MLGREGTREARAGQTVQKHAKAHVERKLTVGNWAEGERQQEPPEGPS